MYRPGHCSHVNNSMLNYPGKIHCDGRRRRNLCIQRPFHGRCGRDALDVPTPSPRDTTHPFPSPSYRIFTCLLLSPARRVASSAARHVERIESNNRTDFSGRSYCWHRTPMRLHGTEVVPEPSQWGPFVASPAASRDARNAHDAHPATQNTLPPHRKNGSHRHIMRFRLTQKSDVTRRGRCDALNLRDAH